MGENGVGRENCDKIEKFRHIDKNELILRKDKIKGGYSKKISYSDFSDSAMLCKAEARNSGSIT